jgi:peroxiredoxin Q/BCP
MLRPSWQAAKLRSEVFLMLKLGAKAPNFHLKSDDGKEVSLKDFHGQRVLLFFYPKANTSGWTIEASEFRDARKDFDKLGVAILGMSADSVNAQASFKAKQKLNFPLLSDPDHKTIEKFGAWQKKQFMGRTFMGIVRSTFLIGKDGKIEKSWEIVKAKGHAAAVLQSILKK